MNKRLTFPLMFVVGLGVACGGDGARRIEQKSYETVEEGSAAGVTSTIHGPGEVLPPVTGTNADTTTAFSIDPNAVAGEAYPIPQTSAVPTPPPQRPVTPRPAPEPEPAPPTDTAPPTQTDTTAPPQEEPVEEEPLPPPTTTDTRGQ